MIVAVDDFNMGAMENKVKYFQHFMCAANPKTTDMVKGSKLWLRIFSQLVWEYMLRLVSLSLKEGFGIWILNFPLIWDQELLENR